MSDESPRRASRRAVLGAGVLSFVSLTGCSALSSQSGMLDLELFNHADSPYTVELGLLRVESDLSRSEARVYSEAIDIEPDGEVRQKGVAENQQYLVHYEVFKDNTKLTDEDHAHYYLADDGGDDSISFDIFPPGVITRRG